MAHSTNILLSSLPERETAVLRPILKDTELIQHTVLAEINQAATSVHFPISAAVSLVVPLASGEVIETAMVGRDGVVGGHAVVNGAVALNRAVVQLAGASRSCPVAAFRSVKDQCPTLLGLIQRHEQILFAQAQQSAACNVTHALESRLARWLLRARDLAGTDMLELTQEYLAGMLGVRRTSLSLIANTLQQAGVIQYRRGRIRIVDAGGLQEISCECYQTVKLHHDTLQLRSQVP